MNRRQAIQTGVVGTIAAIIGDKAAADVVVAGDILVLTTKDSYDFNIVEMKQEIIRAVPALKDRVVIIDGCTATVVRTGGK
jgi:hypothetical protein